ncbi:DUF192 domain-containing protein [Caulobacter sp. NIBR1757]|uniref:DUF192 domain-containing protein n=1 Tax=Caulobacter sp. NIBR1757 TaxID=3016000 RepID=UPI0022F0CD36|nr:DUF192 domain-containing protein [Caulobacter sp. NIBR1757]WGM38867.1 hypothetical protein AMEJIAPC_01775 [Caulobacter sp. NIBR1757]
MTPAYRIGRALLLAAALSCSGLAACKGEQAKPETLISALEPLTVTTASGPVKFQVEIADDETERQNGLMWRESLAPDRGMLFDFKEEAQRSFWMKNTLIPLDILYIAADGTVVSIAQLTTPKSEAPIPSHGAALGVLEIAGGRAGELGIKPGDKVSHRIFKGE